MEIKIKSIILTDMENGLEPILQEVTNTPAENMLTIQSYGAGISHPYGEIMRSVILRFTRKMLRRFLW